MDIDLPDPAAAAVRRALLASNDHQLAALRRQYPDRRIYRQPWGWASCLPRQEHGEVTGATLDELAGKLAAL